MLYRKKEDKELENALNINSRAEVTWHPKSTTTLDALLPTESLNIQPLKAIKDYIN